MSVLVDYLYAEKSLMLVSREWSNIWCKEMYFSVVDPERIDNIPRRWRVIFKQDYKRCSYRIGKLLEMGYDVRIETSVNDARMYGFPELRVNYESNSDTIISHATNKYLELVGRATEESSWFVPDIYILHPVAGYEELVLRSGNFHIDDNLRSKKIFLDSRGYNDSSIDCKSIVCEELYIIDWDDIPNIVCDKMIVFSCFDVEKVKTSHVIIYPEDVNARNISLWRCADMCNSMIDTLLNMEGIKKIDVIYRSDDFYVDSIMENISNRIGDIKFTIRQSSVPAIKSVTSVSIDGNFLNDLADGEYDKKS